MFSWKIIESQERRFVFNEAVNGLAVFGCKHTTEMIYGFFGLLACIRCIDAFQ